jgi:predicted nucleic acid-binding Zn ribbon protein
MSGALRRIGDALAPVRSEAAPATLLAAVQELWPRVAGDAVAAEAEPVGEREGVVTVACRSATWAQELDLLQPQLLEGLREGLSERGLATRLKRLRFTADAARHDRP